jgi:hypothetical protein
VEGLVATAGTPTGLQFAPLLQEPAAPPFHVFTVAKQHWLTNSKRMIVNILMIVIKKLSPNLQDIGIACCCVI